jgi:F0F1-type ATP synthase alpha subunit
MAANALYSRSCRVLASQARNERWSPFEVVECHVIIRPALEAVLPEEEARSLVLLHLLPIGDGQLQLVVVRGGRIHSKSFVAIDTSHVP